MASTSLRLQIKRLNDKLWELQQELHGLSDERFRRQLRLLCVQSWAEGLRFYCSLQHASEHTPQLQLLLEQESELLQQLGEAGQQGASSLLAADSLLQTWGVDTLSPPSDPMASFKAMVSRPPMHEALTMTPQQLAQDIQKSYSGLGILLSKLQASYSAADAHASLKAAMDRHLHLLQSLILVGRPEVIAGCIVYNLDTMSSDPSNMQLAAERTFMVAPHLGLTEQQQAVISTGVELYTRMLASTAAEQQALQAELAAAAAGDACDSAGATSPTPSGSSSSSDVSRSSRSSTSSAALNTRAQLLEERQRMYHRLQLLLQKEYMLQSLCVGFVVGAMSHEQLATAAVLAWPSILRLSHLGIGIHKYYSQKAGGAKEALL